ncbi:MAG TPA: type 4a pilus biogenesis protein PilO [Candidatus Acidoferrales bacterium]|nr:type 4a pilus biogenesis protein PilO [Candidatus Acidoferrales bacterium]
MKPHSWKIWKTAITAALAVLLAADAGFGFFLWHASRQNPESLRADRSKLETQAKLLKADVLRGQRIRASMPQAGKECDRFYREAFLDPGTAYSEIESDLDQIAEKSGLRMGAIQFKQKDVKDRDVTELTIGAQVDGNYSSVIQFINGLERSKKFYLLQDLELQSAQGGGIRLALQLRTFFRNT